MLFSLILIICTNLYPVTQDMIHRGVIRNSIEFDINPYLPDVIKHIRVLSQNCLNTCVTPRSSTNAMSSCYSNCIDSASELDQEKAKEAREIVESCKTLYRSYTAGSLSGTADMEQSIENCSEACEISDFKGMYDSTDKGSCQRSENIKAISPSSLRN